MITTDFQERRRLEALDGKALAKHQLSRLNRLLKAILPKNRFYAEKLTQISPARLQAPGGPLSSLDELTALPFTFKDELISSRHSGDLAANLTFPLSHYTRFHQTSGTRGRPLVVLDTPQDWAWWMDCWKFVLDAAGIEPGDRVFMAFSFGPFVGFWSAFDAACARGCLVVPGGGMGTLSRLALLRTSKATAIFCTPSYALHLAEVGTEHQIDVGELQVRRLILAGEPGGSVRAIRSRIEQTWKAQVLDHSGATEVGPWGYGDAQGQGLFVNENDFIAEFLSVETGTAAAEGELSELVITNLGRVGSPIIRYRTGDLVRPSWQHAGENRFVFLEGGVLSRADDMMIVRGVNIFPSSIEQILRSFPELVEYRLIARKAGEMDQLVVEIEDRLNDPARVATELRLRLGLKVEVRSVPLGSLPRAEGKGKRFVDERCNPTET
ncbi:MAG: phenylacetate--CoA ligase family protein [Planctomycetia bacterium]|nr:phenylacetate--CoA ligase family protein [Planctomycetia bacterium]